MGLQGAGGFPATQPNLVRGWDGGGGTNRRGESGGNEALSSLAAPVGDLSAEPVS